MRIAYLGPAGTFTEDALRGALEAGSEYEPLRTPTIHDAILAVERGEAERALVPFENSIEGSVRSTLDTLAFDAEGVTIVGEHDFAVRAILIARKSVALSQIEASALSPAAARPVRALPPRESALTPNGRASSSTAAAVQDRRRIRGRPGPRSVPRPPPSSTAARSCARESRTRPTTSPASSGSRPRVPSRPRDPPGRPRWSSPS